MSQQEQQDYALFLEKLTVTQESLEATRMDAMEKGIQHGGHLKSIATAERMIVRGFPNHEIADITGLSNAEIEEIRKSLN